MFGESSTTSEYFDPSLNSFVEGPTLPGSFCRHCAAKLGETIVMGGGTDTLSIFYTFDWDSQTWTPMPDIPAGRDNHGCEIIDTANGQELWVVGGYSSGNTYYDSVDVFNFGSGQWSQGVPLPSPRAGLSTVVIDNNIVVFGGQDSQEVLSSILEWTPESSSWERQDTGLDGPRSFFAAILVDERSGLNCN